MDSIISTNLLPSSSFFQAEQLASTHIDDATETETVLGTAASNAATLEGKEEKGEDGNAGGEDGDSKVPGGRINAQVAMVGNMMYLYGGMFEVKDAQYVLRKLDPSLDPSLNPSLHSSLHCHTREYECFVI